MKTVVQHSKSDRSMSVRGHLRRGHVHGTSAMAPIATEDIHHLLVDLWHRRHTRQRSGVLRRAEGAASRSFTHPLRGGVRLKSIVGSYSHSFEYPSMGKLALPDCISGFGRARMSVPGSTSFPTQATHFRFSSDSRRIAVSQQTTFGANIGTTRTLSTGMPSDKRITCDGRTLAH